jgi:CheY-like chemotaxis protein
MIFYINLPPYYWQSMSEETKNGQPESYGKLFESLISSDRKAIERYVIGLLLLLIVSVILIGFNLRLPAGILIILSCSLGVLIVRKSMAVIRTVRNSFDETSLISEKKDSVINDFSHRIREPLNNLVIVGDLLIGSGLQKKQKELLETFIASTNNMVNTVNELTMQTAGSISYEARKKIRFNVINTIQNTVDLFSLKENSNIDFILTNKDLSNYEIIGDPIILKQIFLDLFNTIEDQQLTGITRITISLKRNQLTSKECSVNFRIQTDRNIVLIDENGIGNLAAKLIISANGSFHQEFSNGITILDFTVPFITLTPEIKKQIASPRIEELKMKEHVRKDLKDASILLVEDNTINQKITLLTLKPLVANIDTAINGKEALDKFGTSSYDLILMDIQMPVMSGLVAAEKIRALEASTNAHVPIIAITANAMLGDKERCLAAGMDDYISKPFQPSALIEKIKKFL